MNKEYKQIMLKMRDVFENLYAIEELAESTSFFPVSQYINLQNVAEDFYHALAGASLKTTVFNSEVERRYTKTDINADTDSVRVNSDDDDDEEDKFCPTQYDYDGCHVKRIRERIPGKHCEKCSHLKHCVKGHAQHLSDN